LQIPLGLTAANIHIELPFSGSSDGEHEIGGSEGTIGGGIIWAIFSCFISTFLKYSAALLRWMSNEEEAVALFFCLVVDSLHSNVTINNKRNNLKNITPELLIPVYR
jgi:hypothetical protein